LQGGQVPFDGVVDLGLLSQILEDQGVGVARERERDLRNFGCCINEEDIVK
jgi:hypothetical protein